jgi:hypothetical protein
VAIKIAVALEVESDDEVAAVLKGMRRLLMEQRIAPKYKVKVTRECANEEIGDGMPLDLFALGVTDAADAAPEPTPIEAYAERGEPRPFIRSINSLEREGA